MLRILETAIARTIHTSAHEFRTSFDDHGTGEAMSRPAANDPVLHENGADGLFAHDNVVFAVVQLDEAGVQLAIHVGRPTQLLLVHLAHILCVFQFFASLAHQVTF